MKKVVEGHIDPHKTPPSCVMTKLTCLHRTNGTTKIAKNNEVGCQNYKQKKTHTRIFNVKLYQIEKANNFS
jgi:hypothetical protein